MGSIGPLPAGCSRVELVTEVAGNLRSLTDDATLVVACSGGPDSSALAHLVSDARPDLRLVLVHVAHGLRPRAADLADREIVATHASWLGAELVVRDVEVVSHGSGVEAAARDVRYRALRAVARERDAAAIAVGHSADDQAETVLLRMARGTGIDGLAAMSIVSGGLVRPLLRLRRADLRAFVVGEGVPVATDATNEDDAIRRVRVRREVLPALRRVGPDPVATLGRLADLARDDVVALNAAADALPDAFRRIGPVVALRSGTLHTAPVAIARRVVRRAMAGLVDTPPSAATVTRILDAPVGDAATLPGGVAFRAERAWRTLVVSRGDLDAAGGAGHDGVSGASDERSDAPMLLDVPGRTVWEPAGLTLRTLLPEAGAPPRDPVDVRRIAPGTVDTRFAVILPGCVTSLQVRASRPGDRIRAAGGTRRVVDVLRDAGMPRAIRARWPLVCEVGADARIVWIPGVAVDAERLAAGRREPAMALQASPS